MAHKHDSKKMVRTIWIVFFILLIVTAVEVALGIIHPEPLMVEVMGTRLLNHIFIILTLLKAYYIVAYFMHVKYEKKNLVWTLALPTFILIPYITFIVLTEGSYMYKIGF
ncbi:MAG: cytochrome C oxidase subunit IV family protein [Thermaurantimonas sp.]|uniref:cytochrome C oxidase subunit IV family protein n=1 Tax=Thermaurantimonas sp. TaxID=2681568 RepID=UPI003919A8E8